MWVYAVLFPSIRVLKVLKQLLEEELLIQVRMISVHLATDVAGIER
jgi:hypothetical protein